jgi:oxygen-independent coproporphyrinogen-3 oxidase
MALQIRQAAGGARTGARRIETVFFGGGTPSLLPVSQIIRLLELCRACFGVDPGTAEITIEVNPATIGLDGLRQLARAGFNRISMGAQSFIDRELRVLGRAHTAAQSGDTLRQARRAGFANIAIDLMYGLPGQTVPSWRETLTAALELDPEHLSVYELTIEAGTPFAKLHGEGGLGLPGEEEVLAMLELTLGETAGRGLRRYEISNYARPGFECRHNVNYWRNGSYIGLGAGAVSSIGGRRCTAVADIEAYCRRTEAGESVIAEMEELGREARFRETVVMGLRMTGGISVRELGHRFGIDADEYYGGVLTRLSAAGLLVREGDIIRLTGRGLLLANRVMAELV